MGGRLRWLRGWLGFCPLPVLYAFEHADAADRERLVALHALADPSDAEIGEIMAILERAGAQDFTRAEARRWRDTCLAELDGLDAVENAARDRLRGIIEGVISA